MNPLKCLHLQLRLEGLQVIDGSRLRQVEIVPGEEMPLMILAQLANGPCITYFDESLSPAFCQELQNHARQIRFPNIDLLLDCVEGRDVRTEAGYYHTLGVPDSFRTEMEDNVICFSRHHPRVRVFGFGDFAEKVFAIQRHGRIASACVSTRENGECAEAWVYTDPRYRRQGFAQQVVSAWAQDLLAAGKIPFYSHKIENTASASLASHLGLVPLFHEISIMYPQGEP